jgi:hypothetical protein
VNRSDVEARILLFACSDTVAGVSRLRQILRNPVARERQIAASFNDDFYEERSVMPGDSITLMFAREVTYAQDSVLTMHYLVVYQNPIGDMYDTYYWARYRMGNMPIRPLLIRQVRGRDTLQTMGASVDMTNMLEPFDTNESRFIYPRTEEKGLIRWLRLQAKKQRDSVAANLTKK